MATQRQKVKVGVFLLLCFGLMAVGLVVIAGWYDDTGNHYWMEFEDSVLGLNEGGLVEYLGVPVGKVSEIYVTTHKKAYVQISIDPTKVQLQEGVEGQLVLYSFAAGTMAISLRGGQPDAAALPLGSQIPAKGSAIATISSKIETMMDDLSEIFDLLKGALEGMDEGSLSQIVDDFDKLLKDGSTFLDDGREVMHEASDAVTKLGAKAEESMGQFNDLSDDLRGLTADLRKLVSQTSTQIAGLDISETQVQLNKVLENMAALTEQLQSSVGELDTISASVLHDADNVEHTLRRSMQEITDAFDSVRILVEDLKDDPSALVRGKGNIRN